MLRSVLLQSFIPTAPLFLVLFPSPGSIALLTGSRTPLTSCLWALPCRPLVFTPLFSDYMSPWMVELSQLTPPSCFGPSPPSPLLTAFLHLLSQSCALPDCLGILRRSNLVCWRE